MKVVGSRKPPQGEALWEQWDEFCELAWSFRKDQVFVPKGVYRFKTFEEAEQWRIRMLLGGRPTAGFRPEMT